MHILNVSTHLQWPTVGELNSDMKNKVVIFFILLLFVGCTKETEPEQLPSLSTDGLGTFGCLVDANIWLPRQLTYSLFGSPSKLDINYLPNSGRLWINARREYSNSIKYEVILIEVDSVFQVGNYLINKGEFNDSYFDRVYVDNKSEVYGINKSLPGNCEIVYLDTLKRIISGTFKVSLIDTVTTKEINLTSGVFDLKY